MFIQSQELKTNNCEVVSAAILSLQNKVGSVNLSKSCIFTISPPDIKIEVKSLPSTIPVFAVNQAGSNLDAEDEELFWEQLLSNFSIFLDFVAVALKEKLRPLFVYTLQEDIANTYALGYLVLSGLSEQEAIAALIEQNRSLEFNYFTACVLDELLVRKNKLLEVVEDYETTGIVVSPEGITYTKE
jgi:hypothetical protein